MGVGVHFTCHSLSHIFPSLWSVLYSVLRAVEKEKCGRLTIQISGGKLQLYIYKKGTEREDPNLASFLVPFSSFWKKRNR